MRKDVDFLSTPSRKSTEIGFSWKEKKRAQRSRFPVRITGCTYYLLILVTHSLGEIALDPYIFNIKTVASFSYFNGNEQKQTQFSTKQWSCSDFLFLMAAPFCLALEIPQLFGYALNSTSCSGAFNGPSPGQDQFCYPGTGQVIPGNTMFASFYTDCGTSGHITYYSGSQCNGTAVLQTGNAVCIYDSQITKTKWFNQLV